MEIDRVLDMLLRRWWLILLPVFVALVLVIPSLPDSLNPPARYTVAMRFTAASPSDAALQDNSTTYEDSSYVPWLASEYVVVNFPQWVTSDSFAREVSIELAAQNITIDPDDVRSAFAADSARSYLIIYVTWDDEAEIRAIANAAVTVLQTKNQTYFPQFSAYPAEVVAWDDVRVNTVAPSVTQRVNPFIRLAFAFAAGVALAAAVDFFDDTVRTSEEVTALGLDVLGSVPGK